MSRRRGGSTGSAAAAGTSSTSRLRTPTRTQGSGPPPCPRPRSFTHHRRYAHRRGDAAAPGGPAQRDPGGRHGLARPRDVVRHAGAGRGSRRRAPDRVRGGDASVDGHPYADRDPARRLARGGDRSAPARDARHRVRSRGRLSGRALDSRPRADAAVDPGPRLDLLLVPNPHARAARARAAGPRHRGAGACDADLPERERRPAAAPRRRSGSDARAPREDTSAAAAAHSDAGGAAPAAGRRSVRGRRRPGCARQSVRHDRAGVRAVARHGAPVRRSRCPEAAVAGARGRDLRRALRVGAVRLAAAEAAAHGRHRGRRGRRRGRPHWRPRCLRLAAEVFARARRRGRGCRADGSVGCPDAGGAAASSDHPTASRPSRSWSRPRSRRRRRSRFPCGAGRPGCRRRCRWPSGRPRCSADCGCPGSAAARPRRRCAAAPAPAPEPPPRVVAAAPRPEPTRAPPQRASTAKPSKPEPAPRRAPEQKVAAAAPAREPARAPVAPVERAPDPPKAPPAPIVAAPPPPPPPRPPPPPAAAPKPSQGLDPSVMQSIIARSRPGFDACVEKALQDPVTASYAGRKAALLLLVAPDGKAEAALEDGDLDASPFGALPAPGRARRWGSRPSRATTSAPGSCSCSAARTRAAEDRATARTPRPPASSGRPRAGSRASARRCAGPPRAARAAGPRRTRPSDGASATSASASAFASFVTATIDRSVPERCRRIAAFTSSRGEPGEAVSHVAARTPGSRTSASRAPRRRGRPAAR